MSFSFCVALTVSSDFAFFIWTIGFLSESYVMARVEVASPRPARPGPVGLGSSGVCGLEGGVVCGGGFGGFGLEFGGGGPGGGGGGPGGGGMA